MGTQYRTRFRYYCPEIGAFVSQDPLGLAANDNVYSFGPNVHKWIDPLGLCKKAPKSKPKTYADYAREATQNPKSPQIVLGKYMQDGVSYVNVAKEWPGGEATYFQLNNWNQIVNEVGEKNVWNINKAFLNQQLEAGKEVYFSHDPWNATGYFQNEVLHLIDSGAKDFISTGNNLWKAVF